MRSALASLVLLAAATAHADGAFPDEMQMFLPADQPHRIVVGTNFGLLISEDDGAVWHWVCEQNVTPMLATLYNMAPDHTLYSATSGGLSISTDGACTFRGGMLDGAYVLDVFAGSAAVYVIATPETDGGTRLMGLFRSTDRGTTVGELYTAPLGTFLTGVEVAASNPSLLYATAHTNNPVAPFLLQSTDGGATWIQRSLAAVGPRVALLAAVDPIDSTKVYLRVQDPAGDRLAIVTATAVTVAVQLTADMSAFLRRANGDLIVATKTAGAMISHDGGATFAPWPNAPHLRALGERAGTLYAAADNFMDGYAVGVSHDDGQSWQPLLTFSRICGPLGCGTVGQTCEVPWINLQQMFGIGPDACTPELPVDAGTDAPANADTGGGGGGCGCSVGGRESASGSILLLALVFVRRRRWLALFAVVSCSSPGVPLPWNAQVTLPPGTFWEANLILSQGDMTTAHYQAAAMLDWNVHGHPPDAAIQQYAAGQGSSGDIPFTAVDAGRYSYYWENQSNVPVSLSVNITGRGTVYSTSVGP